MSINGLGFLLFLLVAVAVYYLCPKGKRWVVLLVASVAFYLTYSVAAAGYLLFTTAVTYWAGQALGKRNAAFRAESAGLAAAEKRAIKEKSTQSKRRVLTAALLVNFATLFAFKYLGFAMENVNALLRVLHVEWQGVLPRLLLPLGISFYIFQTAGYLIDVYREKYGAEGNFARYALFVCYFPQMIQGPINRFAEISAPLFAGNDFRWEGIRDGVLRMMWGVLKKAMIADVLAIPVNELYTNYGSYPGWLLFLGATLYCLQLYCDFSGGIDLVCGASELFGVKMQENFMRPYLSVTIADFWRRWHMSLGEWMKDYLFYPLALSKAFGRLGKKAKGVFSADVAKRLAPCLATFIVFLTVGVWQGPGWANVAYGLWNATLMSVAMLLGPAIHSFNERVGFDHKKPWVHALRILRTNLLITIGRYFSHSATLGAALGMLWRTIRHPGLSALNAGTLFSFGLTGPAMIRVGVAAAVVLCVSLAQERGLVVRDWLAARKWYVQFGVLFAALVILVLFVYGNGAYTAIAYVYENV